MINRLACLFALSLIAKSTLCAQSSGVVPSPAGRRFVADSFWVRTWYRGSTKDPELFTEPRQLVVAGNLVVVLDLGLREVSTFDIATGALRSQLAARGEGPGEFKRPLQLVGAGSSFGVLDGATSRLSMFDANGRFTWDTPITNAASTEGICVRRDGVVITKSSGTRDALALVDSSGRTMSRRDLPWPDPGLKSSAVSGFLAGPDAIGNSCVFARRYGPEWLVVPRDAKPVRHRYLANYPEATIAVKVGAKKRSGTEAEFRTTESMSLDAGVSGVMMLGDTAIVRGGPAERDGFRLLDYYLLPTGRYLHSRRLPSVFIATAAGPGGTFFGTTIGEESGALIAFRATATRPETKPVQKAAPKSGQALGKGQPGNAPPAR